MKVKWKTRSSRVRSEAQNWAQDRNWLLTRIRGAMTIEAPVRRMLPAIVNRQDLNIAMTHLMQIKTALEELNTYEKYKKYQQYVKEDV